MQDRKADRHRARREHVHSFGDCLVCGAPLLCVCHTGGRPAKYCSDAHRQEAYRMRQAATPTHRRCLADEFRSEN
jgi:hypothetical protein